MTLRSYSLQRDGADRLLFLLHGWSAEQHHLAAYVPLVDPDERFTAICPRAPHDLPEGDGASWYDRTDNGPVPASFHDAVELVRELVTTESESYGIPLERCVVGGFSQGGFLALAVALGPDPLAVGGVWAMCCALPEVDGLELDLSAGSGAGRPALIQVGELDTIISPGRGRAAAVALDGAGWNVSVYGYPMAHSQRIEMMVDARSWLGAI
jgi:phospholipase/carboxylesterase